MATKTIAQYEAELAELKAKLDAKSQKTCKVTEKGGISVYGLGRFPVTLYPEQWDALAAFIPSVIKFKDEAVKAGLIVQSKADNEAFQAAKAAKNVEVK